MTRPFLSRDELSDAESRTYVDPLDQLHAERQAIVDGQDRSLWPASARVVAAKLAFGGGLAKLAARHEYRSGTYDEQRRVEVAKMATSIRLGREESGKRTTDQQATELALSSITFVKWLERQELEKELYRMLQERATAITERINRDQVLIRFMTSEPKT